LLKRGKLLVLQRSKLYYDEGHNCRNNIAPFARFNDYIWCNLGQPLRVVRYNHMWPSWDTDSGVICQDGPIDPACDFARDSTGYVRALARVIALFGFGRIFEND
jgi:hypothetical protein